MSTGFPQRRSITVDEITNDSTINNLQSTGKNLMSLLEKLPSRHHLKKRQKDSQKSKTIIFHKEKEKTQEKKEEELSFYLKKTKSASFITKVFGNNEATTPEKEKHPNNREKIRDLVKFALYGLRNPYKNSNKKLKRGLSLGGKAKTSKEIKIPEEIINEWNKEKNSKKEDEKTNKMKKNLKLEMSNSYSNSSSSLSSPSIIINDNNFDKKENEKENTSNSNFNLNASIISQRSSSIFDRFGNVSNFISKIFSKENSMKSSLFKKFKNNSTANTIFENFTKNDCLYYRMMRMKQKEAIQQELSILSEDQNRLNLSKELLEKWLRVKHKVIFAIRVNKFNVDIKIYGSTANVGTEINNEHLASKLFVKQETLLKKTTAENKKKKTSSHRNFIKEAIIYPGSMFMNYWSVVIIFLLLYTASITPYRVSFIDNAATSDDAWSICDYFVDSLFMLDIIVTMNLAFYNKDGVLINQRFAIFINYLRTWLIIDVVGIFPFEFLDPSSSSSETTTGAGGYNDLVKLLRLPRLYRLMKLTRLFKIMNKREGFNILQSIQNFFKMKNSLVQVLKFLFLVTIFVHLVGCLWYFQAKLQSFGPDTWVFRYFHFKIY